MYSAIVQRIHEPVEVLAGIADPELWLHDPDGNLIEVHARPTDEELAAMPEDMEPTFLVW